MAKKLDLEPNVGPETEMDEGLETDSESQELDQESLDEEHDSDAIESSEDKDPQISEDGTPEEKEDEKKEEDGDLAAKATEDEEIPVGPGPEPIDLGGGKTLKQEDFKNPELFEEVRRGYLRNADYTQKTQQHAELVRGAANIWENFQKIQNNPNPPLLNWFRPEQLLNVLAQAGFDVDPRLINNQQNSSPAIDPEISRRIQELETRNAEYERTTIANQISSEIEGCLKDIKNSQLQTYIRNRTLAALYQNPHANIREITMQTREQVRKERAATVSTKREKISSTRVGKTTGGSVPVMGSKGPNTWDDAFNSARRRLGG